MSILILNGSPKCEKSDTLKMSEAFARGISDVSGGEIKIIHTAEKKIGYCTGCFICKKNGGTCVIDDDAADIIKTMLKSDYVIFSFPLYCHSMPSSLKVFIERLMPLSSMKIVKDAEGDYRHEAQADLSKMKRIMICGSGYPGSKRDFELTEATFRRSFPDCGLAVCMEESPLFNIKDAEPVALPRLELLKKAGAEYAENGRLSEDTRAALDAPMIPEEIYMRFANGVK